MAEPMPLKTLAVIPARYGSTRLPAKPLLKLKGRELVLWVWEGVRQSRRVERVIVATDHEDIVKVVQRAGGEAMLTPESLPTGSDRVAYVARRVPSRYVLNVQSDDPLISARHIDPMLEALEEDPAIQLALLAKTIDRPEEIERDSIVKMVFGADGRALYFSRSPIPFARNPVTAYYKHIGPYAWRRESLLAFSSWEQTPLEKAESLEMLRLLEKGGIIKCLLTDSDTVEIDTPEDLERFARAQAGTEK
ncbi:MAG: 3-deoxy-manno-octulosonate cytidylyltransferase [Desulfarculales bacterium]|jgi:3-deoxy-manno-octulosonate cytidylyltransferase (CMP-KDO synthetase)|nr:3-deoxy-manno-octulosonate cytidylyltransferase [Desulfarculales bacterium]